MTARALLGGRYELGSAIGSGGFATVFRAVDRQANVDVAVKLVSVLPPAEVTRRLEDEAAILKRLSSRHIARVFDLGSDDQSMWLVTELIDGVPLSTEGVGRALLPHEVLRVARGLLEGLSVAHIAGVVHADIKPSNILLPRTEQALDGAKLIDFGLARVTTRADVARELGDSAPASGVVLGSARWMAPEVLAGGAADARSDVYSAGLVLFELLGEGDLFPAEERSQQLRARIANEPQLEGRVAPPLSEVLARMLARDPFARFADATEAYAAVVDLDTAPVSTTEDLPPSSLRAPQLSIPPRSTSQPTHPSSVPVSRMSSRPSHAPAPRLSTLPVNGLDALRETLRHLDLPMLDALARRERGNHVGRIARAIALSLRLELDAAALILEPVALTSDVARAVGTTVLAPRARRVTRARVDSDRNDDWALTVPVQLAALLATFAAALSSREDAVRDARRCTRILERLDQETAAADEESARRVDDARTTLRIAIAAARVRSGELSSGAALDLVAPLESADRPRNALDRVVRPLLTAAIGLRTDEGRARDDLERAVRAASEHGAPLLEACASAAWGRLLVDAHAPLRTEQGLLVLERAATLLAHGDAPSLEHEAEHHRAAALVVQGKWKLAIPRLHAAREAAHAERALEAEVLSASLEVVAHLALGDHDPAHEAAAALGEARIGTARGRAGAFAWIAKCIEALASGEREAAEDALAEAAARAREADDDADAFVISEVLALLFDAAKGALPDVAAGVAELERFTSERGFTAFYWFDVLRSVIERVDDPAMKTPMLDVLSRVIVLLGPGSRIARDRRTSAPPGMLPGH